MNLSVLFGDAVERRVIEFRSNGCKIFKTRHDKISDKIIKLENNLTYILLFLKFELFSKSWANFLAKFQEMMT